jgi:hypothetical protein
MNKDKWLSIIRHFLTFVGGVLVTIGVTEEALTPEFVGAFVTIVSGIWGIQQKNQNTMDNLNECQCGGGCGCK